jgi:hypothetical protein
MVIFELVMSSSASLPSDLCRSDIPAQWPQTRWCRGRPTAQGTPWASLPPHAPQPATDSSRPPPHPATTTLPPSTTCSSNPAMTGLGLGAADPDPRSPGYGRSGVDLEPRSARGPIKDCRSASALCRYCPPVPSFNSYHLQVLPHSTP